jgi:hypothetical protein
MSRVVPAVQGQVERTEGPRVGAIAGMPEDQALSTAALMEQRTVSSRPDRRGKAIGDPVRGQSGASCPMNLQRLHSDCGGVWSKFGAASGHGSA